MESFIKRIKWKAFYFDRSSESNEQQNFNFGFKSVKTPQKNKYLHPFEKDLHDLVRNIEFKNLKLSFQQQLQKCVKRIKQGPKLSIPADKIK